MKLVIRYIVKTDRDLVVCFTHAAQMAERGFVVEPEILDKDEVAAEFGMDCEVCAA